MPIAQGLAVPKAHFGNPLARRRLRLPPNFFVLPPRRDAGIFSGAMACIYARVSTTDQDLSIQEAALRAAGCDVIRAEKQSGTSTQGRAELRTVLDFIGKGARGYVPTVPIMTVATRGLATP